MDLFADEPDITFWGSALPERAVGPEASRALLSRLFDALPASSFCFAYSEIRARVVGDVAWVNAAGAATSEPGDGAGPRDPLPVTGVLVRTQAGWRWHTHHGSEPTPLDL